ncbi:MAG TPA: phosphoglycolate phosphatase [Bdellovibrionales bacterium]|nr:MAG: phosphoglycolate phosphatase [Bdellovibrionales bacterium GWB1_52_6]OFZ03470.1 MAG: phosphoglycolate phosphatase [Bdellovibrionales bacterium GWA1_52_35]OFZ41356.1 MAG: phosphoglycolate phosphatase [Bdellovibrionales bacterium GWC1_52_8]HAR41743.1 phosphoglycolate phosphatase [Bdellovibrionales bacterium]HCM41054.1 phosphoglycolate phosphatase [Bdellovibrionales bacterium]
MRYFAIAADYDETLASNGVLLPAVIRALERLKLSGRRAIVVTGRRLADLRRICSRLDLFEYVVAENGAVVFNPRSNETKLLSEPLSEKLLEKFKDMGVDPLVIGQVIAATDVSEKSKILDGIQKLGLEAQIIFNGKSLMVLPPGINKASGTAYILRKMGLSFHEVVGIGDSENDYSLLRSSECPIAVKNAISSIKEVAVWVTDGCASDGVVDVIEKIIEDDLQILAPKLVHNHIELGKRLDGRIVWAPSYGQNILIAGPPGAGKSRFAAGLIERIHARDYQVCIIDPEGDYSTLDEIVSVGSLRRAPELDEILKLLMDPKVSLSVNLVGVPLFDRPAFLAGLLPALNAMRARTSRPHWIVIDEAHHMLPTALGTAPLTVPAKLGETVLLTVHPNEVAAPILRLVDTIIAVGESPNRTLAEFSYAAGRPVSGPLSLPERKEDVIAWLFTGGQEPFVMETLLGRAERIRHVRKYAEGDLGSSSFYFRGPQNLLNLKAQNLALFVQISEGLDEGTWAHHLRAGDFSRWFRSDIKDETLADEVHRIESRADLGPKEARRLVCGLLRARYAV